MNLFFLDASTLVIKQPSLLRCAALVSCCLWPGKGDRSISPGITASLSNVATRLFGLAIITASCQADEQMLAVKLRQNPRHQ